MLKARVAQGRGGGVLIMDSISLLASEDAGAIVVSASHGGASSGEIALSVPLRIVFFNDAGVGKDDAGILALAMLQARGVAAGTVAHTSARIGDARDAWESGVISHVNRCAGKLGLSTGKSLRNALLQLLRSDEQDRGIFA